jgi:hypothetical protein
VVAGRRIFSARLTPSAYEHGLALAIPNKAAVARPAGFGYGITTCLVPIEGRDEWVAATVGRRSA